MVAKQDSSLTNKISKRLALLYSATRRVVLRTFVHHSRVHILFLIHDYSRLPNFDTCLRNFLRNGHKLTIVLPEPKPGKRQKPWKWRGSKEGDVNLRFVPTSR